MAAVQVVVDEKLAENALTQGNFIHQRMTEIRQRFSFMTDFRGRGLFLAMEYAPLIRLDSTLIIFKYFGQILLLTILAVIIFDKGMIQDTVLLCYLFLRSRLLTPLALAHIEIFGPVL